MTVSAERAAAHHCHASGCAVRTKPEMLMCARHWFMVPKRLQHAVWSTYRNGQREDMNPSAEWHLAADAAIGAVALKEHRAISANQANALEAAGYDRIGFGYFTLIERVRK